MSKARRNARRAKRRGSQPNVPGNLSGKNLNKALSQMQSEDIEGVTEVIVRTATEEIVLKDPEVTVMNMGQEIWSVVPQSVERRGLQEVPIEIDPNMEVKDSDIQLVKNTAGCSEEEAKQAIINSGGDIAKAIMSLK